MKKILFLVIACMISCVSIVSAQNAVQVSVTNTKTLSPDQKYEINALPINFDAGIEQNFIHVIDGTIYDINVKEYTYDRTRNQVTVRITPPVAKNAKPVTKVRFYALPTYIKNLQVRKEKQMFVMTYYFEGEKRTLEIR